jgi:2-keto-4-pentenoate hydratase
MQHPPLPRASIEAAARLLWDRWDTCSRIDALPSEWRPDVRRDAYAIQTEIARVSGQDVVGWKIAATSGPGQRHIGVESPLAGCILARRVRAPNSAISLETNAMRVAEAEFAFRFIEDLPPREAAYERDEVMAAIGGMHAAIEVPDSRFVDFARVGAEQLIADNACALWLVVGQETLADWREDDLSAASVAAFRNGLPAGTGTGANVLGDPRLALQWIANELRIYGTGLRRGDIVTTGAAVAPVPILPGDRFVADFGKFGRVSVRFT